MGLQLSMQDSAIFVKSIGKLFLGIKLNTIFTNNLREISIIKDHKTISNIRIDKVLGSIKMMIPPIGLQLGMRDTAFFVKSSGKMILDLKYLKTTSTKHIDKVFGGFIMSIPPIGLQLGMRDSAVFVKSSGKMI